MTLKQYIIESEAKANNIDVEVLYELIALHEALIGQTLDASETLVYIRGAIIPNEPENQSFGDNVNVLRENLREKASTVSDTARKAWEDNRDVPVRDFLKKFKGVSGHVAQVAQEKKNTLSERVASYGDYTLGDIVNNIKNSVPQHTNSRDDNVDREEHDEPVPSVHTYIHVSGDIKAEDYVSAGHNVVVHDPTTFQKYKAKAVDNGSWLHSVVYDSNVNGLPSRAVLFITNHPVHSDEGNYTILN